MKQIITVTFKNGEKISSPFKDLVVGETNIDITYPAGGKERPLGNDVELKKVREVTIK